MAATHYSPLSDSRPAPITDPVSYKEASALLARTGHPVASRTIAGWGLPAERRGRTDVVSWTAVLKAHGERTAAKLRCSANW
ncbi:hypothetical protein [Streptomyces sp. NPDC001658]